MDAIALAGQVERACEMVASGERDYLAQGEEVLMGFQEMKQPYEVCRLLLQKSQNPHALFQVRTQTYLHIFFHARDPFRPP